MPSSHAAEYMLQSRDGTLQDNTQSMFFPDDTRSQDMPCHKDLLGILVTPALVVDAARYWFWSFSGLKLRAEGTGRNR